MTRDEAVKTIVLAGWRLDQSLRERHPQAFCDRVVVECAEDSVDILIALGILKVDAAASGSPQVHEGVRQDD